MVSEGKEAEGTGRKEEQMIQSKSYPQGILGRTDALRRAADGSVARPSAVMDLNVKIAFSSKSGMECDTWAKTFKRPFEVVVLPGYTVPKSLEMRAPHAIWVEGEVTKPLVVWDSFSMTALFDLIRVSMDPDGESDFIRVRHAKSGKYVTDLRPQWFRDLLPKADYSDILARSDSIAHEIYDRTRLITNTFYEAYDFERVTNTFDDEIAALSEEEFFFVNETLCRYLWCGPDHVARTELYKLKGLDKLSSKEAEKYTDMQISDARLVHPQIRYPVADVRNLRNAATFWYNAGKNFKWVPADARPLLEKYLAGDTVYEFDLSPSRPLDFPRRGKPQGDPSSHPNARLAKRKSEPAKGFLRRLLN